VRRIAAKRLSAKFSCHSLSGMVHDPPRTRAHHPRCPRARKRCGITNRKNSALTRLSAETGRNSLEDCSPYFDTDFLNMRSIFSLMASMAC